MLLHPSIRNRNHKSSEHQPE